MPTLCLLLFFLVGLAAADTDDTGDTGDTGVLEETGLEDDTGDSDPPVESDTPPQDTDPPIVEPDPSAAQLAGEMGGLTCGPLTTPTIGWGIALLVLVGLRTRRSSALAALLLIALPSSSLAAEDPPTTARISLRATAEQWDDTAIATLYRPGALMGAVGIGVPIVSRFGAELEASYRRLTVTSGSTGTLVLVPLSFIGTADLIGPFYAGLGASVTVFSERHEPNAEGIGAVSGARLGLELRSGLRIDTGLIQRPMAPHPGADLGPHGIDFEIYVARRFQRPGAPGFQLGAWRLAAGLGLRF